MMKKFFVGLAVSFMTFEIFGEEIEITAEDAQDLRVGGYEEWAWHPDVAVLCANHEYESYPTMTARIDRVRNDRGERILIKKFFENGALLVTFETNLDTSEMIALGEPFMHRHESVCVEDGWAALYFNKSVKGNNDASLYGLSDPVFAYAYSADNPGISILHWDDNSEQALEAYAALAARRGQESPSQYRLNFGYYLKTVQYEMIPRAGEALGRKIAAAAEILVKLQGWNPDNIPALVNWLQDAASRKLWVMNLVSDTQGARPGSHDGALRLVVVRSAYPDKSSMQKAKFEPGTAWKMPNGTQKNPGRVLAVAVPVVFTPRDDSKTVMPMQGSDWQVAKNQQNGAGLWRWREYLRDGSMREWRDFRPDGVRLVEVTRAANGHWAETGNAQMMRQPQEQKWVGDAIDGAIKDIPAVGKATEKARKVGSEAWNLMERQLLKSDRFRAWTDEAIREERRNAHHEAGNMPDRLGQNAYAERVESSVDAAVTPEDRCDFLGINPPDCPGE
ncbi:MAG: hypothetical protein HY547_10320 [Elusimicrobia bacterium]|nr:hypothetical protein [Elusimicrobiota bacterium]